MNSQQVVENIHPNYFKHLAVLYYLEDNNDTRELFKEYGVVCLWCGTHHSDTYKHCKCSESAKYHPLFIEHFGRLKVSYTDTLTLGSRSMYGLNQSFAKNLRRDTAYFTEMALTNPLFYRILEEVSHYDPGRTT